MSHTTNKQNQKTTKKASTDHVKSGYVTHNKQKKTKNKQKWPQQNMLNQVMSYTTNKTKTKKQTKTPQLNMLNQLISHTTNKQNKKTTKKTSTEHVKSADVTHNKQKNKKTTKKATTEHVKSADVTHNKQKNKKQAKRPQQNMLNQLMSHTTNKQKTKNNQKGFNRSC